MPAAVKCGVDAVSTGPTTVILGNWVRIDLGTFLDRKRVEKTVISLSAHHDNHTRFRAHQDVARCRMNRVCLIDGCYSAEESVGEWEPITLDGTVSFIEAVTSSVWWTDAFPRSVPVEVIEGGDEPSDARGLGFIRSFAYPVGGFTPERRVISMHPSMLDSRILIHELAHCASASTHGDFDRNT